MKRDNSLRSNPSICVKLEMILESWTGCLLRHKSIVGSSSVLVISYLLGRFFVNCVRSWRLISLTVRNLEINPGLIDLSRKVSFYGLLQRVISWGSSLNKSDKSASTGRGSSLKPLASTWAKYLLSFDRSATASFTLNPSCFTITKISNYSKLLADLGSPLASKCATSTSTCSLAFWCRSLSCWRMGNTLRSSPARMRCFSCRETLILAFCSSWLNRCGLT